MRSCSDPVQGPREDAGETHSFTDANVGICRGAHALLPPQEWPESREQAGGAQGASGTRGRAQRALSPSSRGCLACGTPPQGQRRETPTCLRPHPPHGALGLTVKAWRGSRLPVDSLSRLPRAPGSRTAALQVSVTHSHYPAQRRPHWSLATLVLAPGLDTPPTRCPVHANTDTQSSRASPGHAHPPPPSDFRKPRAASRGQAEPRRHVPGRPPPRSGAG